MKRYSQWALILILALAVTVLLAPGGVANGNDDDDNGEGNDDCPGNSCHDNDDGDDDEDGERGFPPVELPTRVRRCFYQAGSEGFQQRSPYNECPASLNSRPSTGHRSSLLLHSNPK